MPITLRVVVITSWNFPGDVARGWGGNADTNFGKGAPNKTREGKKRTKIRRDFWQLSTFLIANISGMDRRNENLKTALSTTNPPLSGAKNLVNFGPQTKKLEALTNPSGLFQETTFRPLAGAAPSKFSHALEIYQGLLAHFTVGVVGPPTNFKGEHLKFGLKFSEFTPVTLGLVGTSGNFTRRCVEKY